MGSHRSSCLTPSRAATTVLGLVLSLVLLPVLTPTGAYAATGAPTATTKAASSVTRQTATLNADVNPTIAGATVYFTYGAGSNLDQHTTSTKLAGNSLSDPNRVHSFQAAISGLRPLTKYSFKLVATNLYGSATTSVLTFETSEVPSVTTGGVSQVATNSATISGSVTPYASTTAYFEFGTDTGYGATTATTNVDPGSDAVSLSAPLTGLSVGTTYHYRLVANNVNGTTRGADQSFRTTSPPIVQTGGPTEVSSDEATVSGSVNPFGQDTSVYFEYGTTDVYGSSTDTVDVGSGNDSLVLAAPIGGLSPHTAYHYRLVAANASGTTYGADSTLTTSAAPATGSSAPGRTGSASSSRSAHSTPIVISTGTVSSTPSASTSTSATVSAHPSTTTPGASAAGTTAAPGSTLEFGQGTGGLPGSFAGDIATKPHNRNPLVAWLLLGLAIAGLATVGVQMLHDRRAEH